MRHARINRAICSLLIFCIILASGIFVFADNSNDLIDTMKSATLVRRDIAPMERVSRHGGIKAVIDQLVTEGKLSQEKAERINKYLQQRLEEQKLEQGHKHGLINELVDAKIIDSKDAELIRSKFKEIKRKALNEKLGSMVQKGTITEAQAAKIKLYFEKAGEERKEQSVKLQSMTEEQRKAYFKEHKKNGPIVKLVEDGVITPEQAKELKKALFEGYKHKCRER